VNIAVITGVPPLSSGFRGGEVIGLTFLAVPAGTAGITAVEAAKEWLSRGVQKPHRDGGKRFLGVCPAAPRVTRKVQEPADLTNETCLAAGRPPWWVVAGLAAMLVVGGWLRYHRLPGLASASMQDLSRLIEMTS
jgi:hypothetical protein